MVDMLRTKTLICWWTSKNGVTPLEDTAVFHKAKHATGSANYSPRYSTNYSPYIVVRLCRWINNVRGGLPINSNFWIVPFPFFISAAWSSSKSWEERTLWSDRESDWMCSSFWLGWNSSFRIPQLDVKIMGWNGKRSNMEISFKKKEL